MNHKRIHELLAERQAEAAKASAKRKRDGENTIRRLRRKYPGATVHRSYHGAGRRSVQVFDGRTAYLIADINLPDL